MRYNLENAVNEQQLTMTKETHSMTYNLVKHFTISTVSRTNNFLWTGFCPVQVIDREICIDFCPRKKQYICILYQKDSCWLVTL